MSNVAPALTEAATAVAALGACQGDIDLLDDESLQAGLRLTRELEQQLQPYKLWMAAAVAKRSDHTLGFGGLARRNGFPTPAVFIQSLTGTSRDEAVKLARMGELMVEAEMAAPLEVDHGGATGGGSIVDESISGASIDDASVTGGFVTGGSGSSAIATAVVLGIEAGGISLDCADAIRRGLGSPDAAVTAEQLRIEAERLIHHAVSSSRVSVVTPEELLKLARQARARNDAAAVERGQKERAAMRSVRVWEKDGMFGGSWRLTGEDGGAEINTALKLLLASQTGGPRFPHTDEHGDAIDKSAAQLAIEDDRTMDHILADGFTQIVLNGLHVDPSIVPGAGRAAVRVMVTESVVNERSGSAILEDGLTAITFAKLEEYLCEGGTVGVIFGDDGTITVGREQRLYNARQRTALGVRDGGCRFPGCNKPPSWCEAHHIRYWYRDKGRTDLENGILLCRYHHMFIHDRGWEIIRRDGPGGGTYWLRPPASIDPERQLIEMPSKNPLVAAMNFARTA